MDKLLEGNWYIFGPDESNRYRKEQVVRVLDDGSVTTKMKGNSHLHWWPRRLAVREVRAAAKTWWTKDELDKTRAGGR